MVTLTAGGNYTLHTDTALNGALVLTSDGHGGDYLSYAGAAVPHAFTPVVLEDTFKVHVPFSAW